MNGRVPIPIQAAPPFRNEGGSGFGLKAEQLNSKESKAMAETERQKRITGRVMHEFKHGELKSGPSGKAGLVKSRRQAIAIALEEAGASKYNSGRRNQRNLRRTKQKLRRNQNQKLFRRPAPELL